MRFTYWCIALCLLLVGCNGQSEGTAEKPMIIPKPVSMTMNGGSFTFSNQSQVQAADKDLADVAAFFSKQLGVKLHEGASPLTKNVFTLGLDANLSANPEAYKLVITKNEVKLTGATPRGVLMGMQTIHQLFPPEVTTHEVALPCLEITDEPRFGYRGIMIDISRHFFTQEELEKTLDLMALYKLNKLHIHLTDDQGWRIEIKKYPELTKSAYRKLNSEDRNCLRLAKITDNPNYNLTPSLLKVEGGDTIYGGYYTQEQMREVVAYAAQRGIDILPEVDMPGHFMAALDQYPQLSCFNKVGWGELFSTPICPGKDEVITFCENVLAEIFEIFPYEYVHIGGDEVDKTNWKKCPHCQKRMKAENCKDEEELQSWFIHRMEKFMNDNGKKMVGWDEIIEGGLSPTATVMNWRSWEKDAVQKATSSGNDVIQTPNAVFYLDYVQNDKSLYELYHYSVIPTDLSPEQAKHIIGAQGNLWTPGMPSIAQLEYMMVPRMFAISEITWTNDANRDWKDFEARLPQAFARMDAMGVNYRTPDLTNIEPINAFVGETMVAPQTFLSNTVVRYTTDGSTPQESSTLYEGPFKITETTKFKFRMFKPDGSKGDIAEVLFDKQEYSTPVTLEKPQQGVNAYWHKAKFNYTTEIEKTPVHKSYVVDKLTIPEGVEGQIGLILKGYLKAPAQGIYTFKLLSDDGSVFTIGDRMVVDHDGGHGPSEKRGQIALGEGWHPFVLKYFDWNGGLLQLQMFDADGKEIKLDATTLAHE